ncbi:GNAT family N-acetyltransferase [Mesorhizobium sp. Z1-4]|uniref:GNAT family N-acetyltransferase n=1 Tax=Mesorhizobium sp. Z1-4 TaxID=2448478 RepID=UPI000FD852DC|nr:GNAT family N-acetyltransferase [Mesorhizobium sp. Z1-4]
MSEPTIETIAEQGEAARDRLLALNNAHAVQTSMLTGERWDQLVKTAFAADCVDRAAALLIAFDQTADYDSPNFGWFRERYARFVYVDRIVVDAGHQGRGLARRLYEGLFQKAQAAGHDRVVCEVNSQPPNPESDAFHARLGFEEVGRADLQHGAKSVRYLMRLLEER